MNKTILKFRVQPGDRLIVPKSGFRIIQHHALYLGQDSLGTDWIAENKVGIGVRLITADNFFKDVIEITKIERFNGSNSERRKVVERALNQLGKPYDLINYNCESFANHAIHNRIKSKQVENSFGLFGFFLLLVVGVSVVKNN